MVGVLSLGILAPRAVIERRRSIGMLRAIGYQPAAVLAALMVEAVIAASIGVAAGLTVGLSTGYAIIASEPSNFPHGTDFRVDPVALLVPVALVFIAVLGATIGPALRAARMPAAEALRRVD